MILLTRITGVILSIGGVGVAIFERDVPTAVVAALVGQWFIWHPSETPIKLDQIIGSVLGKPGEQEPGPGSSSDPT